MKKYTPYIKILVSVLFLFFAFHQNIQDSQAASKFEKSSFYQGMQNTAVGTGYISSSGTKPKSIAEVIGQVIAAILSFLGVIFLCLMIYGGYLWMLARGNEQEVEKAKNIIKNAVIGLAIVLFSYLITYIIGKVILWRIAL